MLIVLTLTLILASAVALAVLIVRDGYGTRPVPRSHRDPFPARRLR